MKRFVRPFALLALFGLAAPTAEAQLYWDSNGTTAGAGATPTGTWGVDNFWNTDSTGGAAGTFSIPTFSTSDVFFSAGSDAVNPYTVGLNSATQNARLVTFKDGTATLDTGTLSLGNLGGITVTSNTVTGATISSGLTISGSQTFNVAASRTLTLDTGTFTRNAGSTLNVLSTGTVTTTMTGLASGSLVNGIIGPWASHGSGASTRYATIDGSDNIVGLTGTAAATAANVTSVAGTFNYDVAAVGTLGVGANINTLRYTGAAGTIAGALTTNGIMNASGNALTFSGAITGGSSGLVVNSAGTGTMNFNAAVTMTGDLIIDGSGTTVLNSASAIIGGTGNLIKNGSGAVGHGGNSPLHNFTGNVIVNGGSISSQTQTWLNGRNVQLTDGYIGGRFGSGYTWTSGLGTGANQIQITGGTSGFSGEGNTGSGFQIGAASSVLKWGASGENGATGFFNPTVFLANGTAFMNTNGKGSLNNGIDLNGTNRTITSTQTTDGAANSGFTISGVISNSIGTAGFEKTGVGNLILGSANTYNGTTTITGGALTAGNTASLGSGAASNTLIFNGGTLLANAAFNSVATRGVTMTATGIINTNTFAVGILGNIGGAGGLTKNSTGTLTLSGTNNYGGVTTVNAGTLAITREVALASNTAANLNVRSGATLQLNVDSAGTAGFTSANLSTLLGNISVANTAAQGLQRGATLAISTATATGATFTPSGAITNSTGSFGGVINLTKVGAGTLVLDQANTYTGITTITTGTLQLGSGGAGGSLSISSPLSIGTGATFAVNQTDTVTQGTEFSTVVAGAGSVANTGSGTLVLNSLTSHTGNTTATAGNITLSHQRAIQFSALNTTGAGTVTLSGTGSTTPIFGGLSNSGTTRNLASVIDSSYASVTNLTLNPQSGSSFTYGGVIADGAAGMDLTKTGAGTQTLTGTNTYTGDTFLNDGTLTLSGAAGSIASSTGITFNGGGLTLTNTTGTEGAVNRIGDSTAITSNGGTLTYANSSVAAGVYLETIGSVALTSGQLNLVQNTSMANGVQAQNNQTLALAGLTQSGSAVVTFSAITTAPQTFGNRNMIRVNGITTDTAADQIIGAWATVGTASNSQTDYAVYDSDNTNGFIVARNTAGSAETTWTTAANAYTNALAAQTLTGTRTITALRNTGATATLTLATGNNLETYGVLNGAATRFTIAPGTGGVLTTPTGGGNLYLTTHGIGTSTDGVHNGINITAPINDNGGAVTLVKSGPGVLQLNATSNYSGGTVLNSGTLWAQSNASLGDVNGDITFNGSATLLLATSNGTGGTFFTLPSTRSIIVNNGAMATIAGGRANANPGTINSDISGTGGVTVGRITLLSSGGVGNYNFALLGTNTFTGALNVGTGLETAAGAANNGLRINTLADSTSPITLNFGSGGFFDLASTAPVNLSVPNRPVNLLNSNLTINNLSATRTMTLGSVSTTTALGQTLRLGAGGAGGFISGAITNGAGTISVTKSGTGTWTLSGFNTYSGATTVSGGTLAFADGSLGQIGTINASGGTLQWSTGNTQDISNRLAMNAATTSTFNTNGNNVTFASSFGSSTTGALAKAGAGTLTLNGTNTYTGITTVSAGVLEASVLANGGSNSSIGASSSAATSLVFGAPAATLRYVGGSNVTTNRSFTMSSGVGGGATIESSGLGTLSFDNAVALAYGTANQTRTLTLGGNNTGVNTFGKVLANNGAGATSLVKSGTGLWVLSQANTYNGTTSVNAGTLRVNGSLAAGSAVTVLAGATLGGNGTISGATTIDGFHTPGNSPGIQTFGGGLTYGGASTLVWELIDNTADALDRGTDYDGVNVTGGSFVLTSGAEIDLAFSGAVNFANAFWQVDQEWLVVDLIGGATAADTNLFTLGSITGGGYSPTLGTFGIERKVGSNAANSVYLTWVAVPEPSTIALLGVGVAIFGFHLARRRKA